jgi:hypothetical protein
MDASSKYKEDQTDCIVCKSEETETFVTKDKKRYWQCQVCLSNFLDKDHHIGVEEEKSRYLEHQNSIEDPDYRKFLSRLSTPLIKKLSKGNMGLDYGCGHGPALADILKGAGYNVDLYDPFFFPDKDVFSKQYNFITCTETAEHFFEPYKEFEILDKLLCRSGFLGIMTSFLPAKDAFEGWYYRRDPTHVVFYSNKSFEVIADQRNWHIDFLEKDVVIFRKTL